MNYKNPEQFEEKILFQTFQVQINPGGLSNDFW